MFTKIYDTEHFSTATHQCGGLAQGVDKAVAPALNALLGVGENVLEAVTTVTSILLDNAGLTFCTGCVHEALRGVLLGDSFITILRNQKSKIKKHNPGCIGSPTVVTLAFVLKQLSGSLFCCVKHELDSFRHNPISGECLADAQINSYLCTEFISVARTLCPGFTIDKKEYRKAAEFCRSFSSIYSGVEKMFLLVSRLLDFSIDRFTSVLEIKPDEVNSWLDEVNDILVLYEVNDGGFLTHKDSMTFFTKYRRNIYKLYTRGKVLMKKFIHSQSKHGFYTKIEKRVTRLEKLISESASLYIGNDKKEKPLLIYLWGTPGVGKTVSVDHIFTDLFALLERKEYNPATDKYCYNSMSSYFDTYAHQSVFEVSDFLQMRDKSVQMQEIVNVLKCGDESAFPLNMADCPSKGITFFTSEFIVCTSNVNPSQNKTIFSSIMAEPDAFIRRIDVNARVSRKPGQYKGYDKDSMVFTVDGLKYTYNEFVVFLYTKYRDQLANSTLVTDAAAAFNPDRINEMRSILQKESVTVGNYPSVYSNVQVLGDNTCVCSIKDCEQCRAFFKTHNLPVGEWHPLSTKHKSWKNTSGDFHRCRKECAVIAMAQNESIYDRIFATEFNFNVPTLSEKIAELRNKISPIAIEFNCVIKVAAFNHHYVFGLTGRIFQLTIARSKVISFSAEDDVPSDIYQRAYSLKIPFSSNPDYEQRLLENYALVKTLLTRFAAENSIHLIYQYAGRTCEVGGCDDFPYLLKIHRNRVSYFQVVVPTEAQSATIINYDKDGNISIYWGTEPEYYVLEKENPRSISKREFLPHYLAYLKAKILKKMEIFSSPTSIYRSFCSTLRKFFDPAVRYICEIFYVTSYEKFYEKMQTLFKVLLKAALAMVGFGLTYYFCKPYVISTLGHVTDGSDEIPTSVRKIVVPGPKAHFQPHTLTAISVNGQTLDTNGVVAQMSPGTANVLMHNIRPNIGILSSIRGNVNVVGICDHIVAFVEHAVSAPSELLTAVFPGGLSYHFTLNQVQHVLCSDNHLYFVDLGSIKENRQRRSFSNIIKYFVNETNDNFNYDGFVFGAVNLSSILTHVVKMANNIKFSAHPVKIQVKNMKSLFVAEDCISYDAYTVPGDCTAPVVANHNNQLVIVGLHCARQQTGKCYAGYCTQEWVRNAVALLNPQGQIKPRFEDFATPVEYIDEQAPAMYMPRKTQLVKSPFWVPENSKSPSPLKGNFDGRTPLEISMHKSLRKMVVPDPKDFNDERDWLLDIYSSDQPKQLLTLKQAIFGEESLGISSVSGKASVGYPWNTFTNRKELLDLNKKHIHPSLSEAVNEVILTLNNGCKPEFLVVDLLKDEKLPLNKVAVGKARIFCVLPIHINLVLKMYFGHFLQHVMNLHNTHPARIGMSLSATDSASLATTLFANRSDVSYLSGDFAASDRCIPFEIFMVLIDFVNKWYGDSYSEHRILLGQAVFQPTHDCDGLRYKTRQGMPSGLYLTSVFNSLAYALVFKKVFNTLNAPLLSIVTYGDDHVLVANTDRKPTVEIISRELERYGLTYTGPSKTDLPAWVTLNEVDFLQRKLVYSTGVWYFRMPVKNIVDNMGYYRRTAETKNWSKKKLLENLAVNAFYEFFQHGEVVYDRKRKEYEAMLQGITIPSFSDILLNYVSAELMPLGVDFIADPTFGLVDHSDLFETADGQSAPSTDQTQIGDVEKVTKTENLTGFVELEPSQPTLLPKGLPVLDASFEWGKDYSKSLERFFLIDTLTLDNADPTSTPFYRVNPVLSLLNEPYLRDRLFQARGIRFDLEIQVRVIATKFHYGQIMGLFRPALAQNQIAAYFKSSTNLEFTQWEWGPYDHISTASQCTHKVIPITQGPPASFVCEWHYPYNWINVNCEANSTPTDVTSEAMSEMAKFAIFDLYKTTPIQPSDLDQPQLLVWGRLKNVRLFGYVGEVTNSFVNFSSVWPTPIAWGQIDELVEDFKTLEQALEEIEKDPQLTLFTETALKYLITKYQVAEAQSEQKDMDSSWTTTPLKIAKGVGSVVGHVTQFISGLARLGFSHPRKDQGPELFNENVYNTSTSVGLSNALTLSYRADDGQKKLDLNDQPKTIDFFGSRPTFISWKTFTNLDTSESYIVSHGMLNNFSGGDVYTPAGYLTRFFKYSRSAVKLYFHFSASAMIAARVTIMATPVASDTQLNYLKVTHTIDVQGDMLEELDLPYLEQFAYNEDGPLWHVTVTLVSAIVSPEAANTRPILLAFWVAFPGLEVGVNSLSSGTALEIPRLTIAVGQMDSTPGLQGSLTDPASDGFGLTSAPVSIYHLMKRMSGYYDHGTQQVLSYRPARPYFPPAGYAIHAPIWYYIIAAYKYIHGGFETLIDSEPIVTDTQAISTPQNSAPVAETTAITPSQYSLCGGILTATKGKPYFVIPYRAQTPYSFVEYPIYGFHGNETYRRTSIPSKIVQTPVTIKATTISSWPADDFEVFLWVGTPVVNIATT